MAILNRRAEVKLTDEEHAKLFALARATSTPAPEIMRAALLAYLAPDHPAHKPSAPEPKHTAASTKATLKPWERGR